MPAVATIEQTFPDDPHAQSGVWTGVTFVDLDPHAGGHYAEEYGTEGIVVERQVRCLWPDRHKLANDALGSVQIINHGFFDGTGDISRRLPAFHPSPNLKRLRAVTVTGATGRGFVYNTPTNDVWFGQGGPTFQGSPADGYATPVITYQVPPYRILSDVEVQAIPDPRELGRWVERRRSMESTYISLPGKALRWAASAPGTGLIEESSFKVLPSQELTYVLHDWPRVPMKADLLMGTVNNATFDGTAWGWPFGYAAGTLLYLGCEHEVVPMRNPMNPAPDAIYDWIYHLYRVNLKFAYRKDGHNNFFRASTGTFEPVVVDVTGAPPFSSSDFSNLFKVG